MPSPPTFLLILVLHGLCHEGAQFLCRPLLHLLSGVAIGAEREACIVVAEHRTDRFSVAYLMTFPTASEATRFTCAMMCAYAGASIQSKCTALAM